MGDGGKDGGHLQTYQCSWALGTDNFLGVEGPSISVSQGPGGVLNRYLTLHLIVNIIVNGDGALLSLLPWLGVDSM